MRSYPLNRWVAGAKKQECPRCGFDWLDTEMVVEERTGLLVCRLCYDPPHPQDRVRAKTALGGGIPASTTTAAPGATVYNEEG